MLIHVDSMNLSETFAFWFLESADGNLDSNVDPLRGGRGDVEGERQPSPEGHLQIPEPRALNGGLTMASGYGSCLSTFWLIHAAP